MFGSEIRDKDGIAATVSASESTVCHSSWVGKLMFAEMVTELHDQGSTVQNCLKGLYDKCVSVDCLTPLLVHNNFPDTVTLRCVNLRH